MHSHETGRSSNEIVREGTGSGDTPPRSQDSSSFLRNLSDLSIGRPPTTPKDYLTEITKNVQYLNSNEQKHTLPRCQEAFIAFQKAEGSQIPSPIAQSFMGFLGRKMPEKVDQGVGELKQTWLEIARRRQMIGKQLENLHQRVELTAKWVQKKLDEQPNEAQPFKNDWDQTYQQFSSHQENLPELIKKAKNFNDIEHARQDSMGLFRKLSAVQHRMLQSINNAWYERIVQENREIGNFMDNINKKTNEIQEKRKAYPKDSSSLQSTLRNVQSHVIDLRREN